MMRFMRFRIRELDRLYICGNVGGTWSDVDWSNISLTDERFNKNTSGFIGGGQIGYIQQFGNIVLGVGATVSGVDLSQRLSQARQHPHARVAASTHPVATCWRGGSNHARALLDCGPSSVLWAVLGENRMVRASANSRRAQLPIGRNAEAGNPVQSQTRPLATGTTTAQP